MKRFFLVLICFCLIALQSCGEISSVVAEAPSLDTMKNTPERITRFLVMGCDRSARLADCIMVITVCESNGDVS